MPASLITAITPTELANGRLVNEGFTGFIYPTFGNNPNPVITAGPAATALQAFVNRGGIYVGFNVNGTTSARNAGITCLNTQTITGISTPGSLYDGAFDISDPVAWGYDAGGWIYRDLNASANYDPATLNPAGLSGCDAVPRASAAVSFGPVQAATGQMYSYGCDVNAVGASQLANRPAVVDQPFGAGRAVLIGTDPYYRAWVDGNERLVLNALLYPAGSPIAPDATATEVAAAAQPQAQPIAERQLPAVKSRADNGGRSANRDLRIQVRRSDGAKLRKAVTAAHLSRRLRALVRHTTTKSSVTLVMCNVRTADTEDRQLWVGRIMGGLQARGVKALSAQI